MMAYCWKHIGFAPLMNETVSDQTLIIPELRMISTTALSDPDRFPQLDFLPVPNALLWTQQLSSAFCPCGKICHREESKASGLPHRCWAIATCIVLAAL